MSTSSQEIIDLSATSDEESSVESSRSSMTSLGLLEPTAFDLAVTVFGVGVFSCPVCRGPHSRLECALFHNNWYVFVHFKEKTRVGLQAALSNLDPTYGIVLHGRSSYIGLLVFDAPVHLLVTFKDSVSGSNCIDDPWELLSMFDCLFNIPRDVPTAEFGVRPLFFRGWEVIPTNLPRMLIPQ